MKCFRIVIMFLILLFYFNQQIFANSENEEIDNNEILININIEKKSDYAEGILVNNQLYIEKIQYLKIIEFKNQNRIEIDEKELDKITYEVESKEYINFEKLNELLKINELKKDMKNYDIDLILPWKLKYQEEEDILNKRKFLKEKKNKIKMENYEKEEWKKWSPGILGLGYSKFSGEGNQVQESDINYVNNIFYGSTNLNITLEESKNEENKVELDYAYWERDIIDNKGMTIGDTYSNIPFNINDTAGNIVGTSIGFKNSWDSKTRVNQKYITGYLPTGTIVELYENGVLTEVQTVSNGMYRFEVELENGSKNYSIKKYMTNGEVIEEKITLLGVEAVLNKGEFDYRVEFGGVKESEDKFVYSTDVRYGVWRDFTVSTGGFNLFDDNYKNKDFYTLGENNIIEVPFFNGSIFNNIYYANDGQEDSMNRYSLWFTKEWFTIGYRRENYEDLDSRFQGTYEKNATLYSDLDMGEDTMIKLGITNATMSNNIENFFDENGKSIEYEAEKGERYRDYYINAYRTFEKISLNIGFERNENKTTGVNENSFNPGGSYNLDSDNILFKLFESISVDSEIGEKESRYNVNLNKNGSKEWGWYINYSNNSKSSDERFGIMVSYTFDKKVKISTDIQKEDEGAVIENRIETKVYLGVDNEPVINYQENNGDGSIKGIVYLDNDGDGKYSEKIDRVIKNTKIETSSNSTISNEKGEYLLGGISTYSPVEVKSTTDRQELPYTVDRGKDEKIKLNPGGYYELDIKYTPMLSVMSSVEFEKTFYLEDVEEILKNLNIEYENLITKEKYTYKYNSMDFLVNTLPVGKYCISLSYNSDTDLKFKKKYFYIELYNLDETEIDFNIKKNSEGDYTIEAFNNGEILEEDIQNKL